MANWILKHIETTANNVLVHRESTQLGPCAWGTSKIHGSPFSSHTPQSIIITVLASVLRSIASFNNICNLKPAETMHGSIKVQGYVPFR